MSVRLICVFKCLWQQHDVCESQNKKIKIIKHVKHSRLYYCGSNQLPVFSSSSLTWSSIFFPFLSFLVLFSPILHHSLSFLFFLLFLPIPPTPFPRSPPPPCVSCNITLRSLAPLPPELSSLPFHLHLFLVPLWLCSWTSRPVRRHVTLSATDLWDLIFTLVFLLRQNSPSYRDVNFVTVSPRVRPARLGFSVGF